MEVGDYVAVMDGNRIVTLGWVDMAGRFDETIGCQRFRVNNGEASIYYNGTSLASLAFASEVFGTDLDLDTTQQVAGGHFVRYEDGAWKGWLPVADLVRACAKKDEIEARARKAADDDTDGYAVPGDRDWEGAYRRWRWQYLHDTIQGHEDASDPWGVVFGDKTPGAVCEDAGDDLEGYVAQAVAEARRIGAVCLPPNVVERLVDEAEY